MKLLKKNQQGLIQSISGNQYHCEKGLIEVENELDIKHLTACGWSFIPGQVRKPIAKVAEVLDSLNNDMDADLDPSDLIIEESSNSDHQIGPSHGELESMTKAEIIDSYLDSEDKKELKKNTKQQLIDLVLKGS